MVVVKMDELMPIKLFDLIWLDLSHQPDICWGMNGHIPQNIMLKKSDNYPVFWIRQILIEFPTAWISPTWLNEEELMRCNAELGRYPLFIMKRISTLMHNMHNCYPSLWREDDKPIVFGPVYSQGVVHLQTVNNLWRENTSRGLNVRLFHPAPKK